MQQESPHKDIMPVWLRGIRVYPFETVDSLMDYAFECKGLLVAMNAEKILNATPHTKKIFNENITYCDGGGAVLAVRQKGGDKAVKIAGCDLWLKLVQRYHKGCSFYIIGAKKEVNDRAVEKLREMYPSINIAGHRDGYINTPQERQQLIDDIVMTKPDIVFVAMGSPRQELLMAEMKTRHKAVYQGLGGSLDVFVGNERRAPLWFQKNNLEFLYRIFQRPGRIKRNIKYFKFAWWLIWKKF